jgi:hypothetical protein
LLLLLLLLLLLSFAWSALRVFKPPPLSPFPPPVSSLFMLV